MELCCHTDKRTASFEVGLMAVGGMGGVRGVVCWHLTLGGKGEVCVMHALHAAAAARRCGRLAHHAVTVSHCVTGLVHGIMVAIPPWWIFLPRHHASYAVTCWHREIGRVGFYFVFLFVVFRVFAGLCATAPDN